MASAEATYRRRMNRKMRRESDARRREARNRQSLGIPLNGSPDVAWQERQRKDREAAARLCAKHFADPKDRSRLLLPTPIVLLWDYWAARACGWDVLTAEYSRDEWEYPCPPSDSWTWRWWESLHYRQRAQFRTAIKEHFHAKRKAG